MYSGKIIKQFSVGLLTIIISGCNFDMNKKPEPNTVSQPVEIKQLGTSTEPYDRYYQIYTLEGCEYIVVDFGNNKWGTHNGNCKNPIHNKTK